MFSPWSWFVLISGTKQEHLSLMNMCSINGVVYLQQCSWGVVFMHHCCKNDTQPGNVTFLSHFFRLIEDISVSLCSKNNDLMAKCLIFLLKCLSKAPPCEGKVGSPSTYIYTNTQKWYFKG